MHVKRLDPNHLFKDDGSSSPGSDRHPVGSNAAVHVAKFDWLYDNQFMSDVKLQTGAVQGSTEKQEIYAHRSILGVHSTTYRSMFESGWAEESTPVIEMHYSHATCITVLRHIYCCETNITLDTALEVFDAAVFFQLSLLRDATVRFLKTRISEQTVFDVLNAALLYNDSALREHCVAYARQTNIMTDVLYSDALHDIPKDVLLILVGEAVIDSDVNILQQLHGWCVQRETDKQGCSAKDLLHGFLKFINFTTMTKEELSIVEAMSIVPVDVLYSAFKNKVLGVEETAQRRGAIHLRWDDTQDISSYDGENHLRKPYYKDGWDVVVALNKFSKGKHYWVYTIHDLRTPHDCLVGVSTCRTPPQEDPFLTDDRGTIFYEPCCNKVRAVGGTVTKHVEKDDWLSNPFTDIGIMVNFSDNTVSFYHHTTKTLLFVVEKDPLPTPLYPYAAIYYSANGGVSMSDTTTFLGDRSSYRAMCGSCGSKSPLIRSPSGQQKLSRHGAPSAG
eukprot:TRINITY_DN14526_c0_g1_i1.p1 TRINITY_DN14526_c0_g1~~TRINITY_DN14526_c0_g1_i1.p1  ORF type:complete len:503 (+),score=131.97 TRINITY_DN14526_c0_g1_i1:39-1547(+)